MQQTPGFYKPILLRTAFVVLPTAALLGVGSLSISSWYFYASLGLILVCDVFRHKNLECVATAIACSPLMILLRGDLFYSGPQVIYALVLLQAPMADLNRVRRNRLVAGLVVAGLVYWLVSFAYNGHYYSNFRAVELAFGATLVFVLASHRVYLYPALLGLSFSTVLQGFALLANGSRSGDVFRLGLATVEGHSIGNPISFGVVTALAFLLTISGGGRWLGLSTHPKTRLAIQLICAMWLVLSTSRGSWLLAIAGAAIIAWTERRQRIVLVVGAVVLVLAGTAWISLVHDATLSSYLDKTFSTDTSLDKLTTGRAEQWASFPQAWSDAPIFGHGPGTSLTEGRLYFDRNLIYHALILQIGVETGTFGLAWLALFFFVLFARAYRYLRVTGDPVPLIGAVGYFLVGLTVPALDAASASLLGLGLVGSELANFYYVARPSTQGVYAGWQGQEMYQRP